jgi:hypothetical protein
MKTREEKRSFFSVQRPTHPSIIAASSPLLLQKKRRRDQKEEEEGVGEDELYSPVAARAGVGVDALNPRSHGAGSLVSGESVRTKGRSGAEREELGAVIK